MGTDWTDAAPRPLHGGGSVFRVGERECSPERMRFDTVVHRLAHGGLLGHPVYRALSPGPGPRQGDVRRVPSEARTVS